MFYFIIKIIFYLLIILSIYYFLNKHEIKILEIIILLFIFNICIYSMNNNISIIYTLITSLIILLSYYLYNYLYNTSINKKITNDNVIINRGIINFNSLIKEKISYDNLIYELKKKGIDNPSLVDYCIRKNNEFIIFKKNSIRNYPISLIIDGNILKDNLFSINKSLEWMNQKIMENSLELKDINYAYFKNKEIYFITN
ncbi:MAG: DUF421 domain-containing protein [Bacilli bacterium]|nr:DUF421 domain-containing protein [Bacilli bacterium]